MGVEATARPGAFILAANHISHFDPPLLAIAIRRKIDWMAMVELFENPIAGRWLCAIDSFPVNRGNVDRRAVRTAIARLKLGRAIGIFPEGGIRDGARSVLEGGPIRPGLGAIAQLGNAPVIPCVILGSDRLYACRTWRLFRRTTVWIGFGEPLYATGSGKRAREDFDAALGGAMRQLMAELRDRFGLAAEDMPQPSARRKGRF